MPSLAPSLTPSPASSLTPSSIHPTVHTRCRTARARAQTRAPSRRSDAVFLAGEFTKRATQSDCPFLSDRMKVQATRIESIACGLLRVLSTTSSAFLDAFLGGEISCIRESVHSGCRHIVGSPE
eukprot:1169122-Prymnesium_polylepis.1